MEDNVPVVHSRRGPDLVLAGTLAAYGLWFVSAVEEGTVPGVLMLLAVPVVLRRREYRIEPDALVMRGYFRTRRLPWETVAVVEVAKGLPLRHIAVTTSDGKAHSLDGVGAWRRTGTDEHRFAEAASALARGTLPKRGPVVRRRFLVPYVVVMVLAIVLLVIGLATQDA